MIQQITIEEMEQALRNTNFFAGGLSDEGIEYYFNKLSAQGKIKYISKSITQNEEGIYQMIIKNKDGELATFYSKPDESKNEFEDRAEAMIEDIHIPVAGRFS